MSVNVQSPITELNGNELLAWLNISLQTHFTKVEQICTDGKMVQAEQMLRCHDRALFVVMAGLSCGPRSLMHHRCAVSPSPRVLSVGPGAAAFCQLMDWLFPGSLVLDAVRCQSTEKLDAVYNYRLLQTAFKKVGLTGNVPVEALLNMDVPACLKFLQWFKSFFDRNTTGRQYDALKARKGRSMGPPAPTETIEKPETETVKMNDEAQDRLNTPTKVLVKTNAKVQDRPKRRMRMSVKKKMSVKTKKVSKKASVKGQRAQGQPKRPTKTIVKRMVKARDRRKRAANEIPLQYGEIVVTISDDDGGMEEDAEVNGESRNGEETEEEEGSKKHWEQREEGVPRCTETIKNLIKKYMLALGKEAEPVVSYLLSPKYISDLVLACSHTPYCLYLYFGVELGDGLKATVILVGYYDQSSGVEELKLLDARLSPEMNKSALDKLDSHRLIAILKIFGLSLYNLAVFYCDSPDPAVSMELERRLRDFRPGLVSLCSLPGLAGRACRDGLQAAFGQVAELVKDLNHHFSNCSSPPSTPLREMLACARHYQPSIPITAQCLFISHMLRKMAHIWQDLEDYFESLAPSHAVQQICGMLKSTDVRLGALFLSQALQPLCAFQEAHQSGSAELSGQLQLMAALSHAFAARILKTSAVDVYLTRRDPEMLRNVKLLQPDWELQVSPLVSEYLLGLSGSEALDTWEWKMFLGNVVAFSRAVLESLGESTPDQLGYASLQNMGLLLTLPQSGKDLKSRGWLLRKLCMNLGLSSPGSQECSTLTTYIDHWLQFESEQKKENETEVQSKNGEEKGWVKVLGLIKKGSLLRTLLQILLALPRCLNRDKVFAKVSLNRDKVFAKSCLNRDKVFVKVSLNRDKVFAKVSLNRDKVFAKSCLNMDTVFAKSCLNMDTVFAKVTWR
ncbi:Microtubule-associated protein RP/EB family member 3 [Merluccius polli]|uniref:Microtubule-associated protein RP/EB family member 3 n=1 Tax=Merluccius polli TaxID=89951 RepID=A0AA47PBE6_MERPO|nr:Microtubule-associated protein RP/EB family member 3 [Merluccius polli]